MLEDGTDQPRNPETIPIVAVTMGDAAGIGPEIILKALSDPDLSKVSRNVVVGSAVVLEKTAKRLGLQLSFVPFADTPARVDEAVEVVDLGNISGCLAIGRESAEAGRASAEYIETAVRLWREKKVDAIATAPINKASLVLGGYNFPGHTEFLAKLTETREFAMSFFAEKLRVVLLSTHLSLRSAIDLVTRKNLVGLIEFTDVEIGKLLHRKIRIAVAGLNPHASEGGLFGDEEQKEIIPAVRDCRDKGIDVAGPFSPDTIFLRGFNGDFDAVVACYHDQATIAVKSLSFGSSVNVTLGLPLIRTSVDHGTAFDIAGRGVADASSMKAAIRLASELVNIRGAATA
ncbi:MAG TPA: 4-hydroxythreonine-4-phosphate dehydrogenase PdxA [Pyrinomonadaceae bacterium]|jgi:4-hydroxythreonine-4-phosphate dehydrogenase|nr:4-hydroxythreonine-4-phosphate dehydrogenase PdxA [Pyrinomonadaceae bacterium]